MKGILFTAESEALIRDGRKTMTRRVIVPQPSAGVRQSVFVPSGIADGHGREIRPRYLPGEIVYVKRTYFTREAESDLRIRILGVKAERLQNITVEDCIAEGCLPYLRGDDRWVDLRQMISMWDSINGKRHPWALNPWVFAYTFRRE